MNYRTVMQNALDALRFYQKRCNEQGIYSVNRQPLPVGAIADLEAALAVPLVNQCGETCERAKLCYGCGKRLDEANVDLAGKAEQEPVAQVVKSCKTFNVYEAIVDTGNKLLAADTKLYAAPVRTKDLTDDEINKISQAVTNAMPANMTVEDWKRSFARASIAKDREKNK